MRSLRPHDLVRLSEAHLVHPDAPPWARAALNVTPWVVVRRASASHGRIAVGVRGTTRSDRYAAEIDPADVCEVVTPEDLALAIPMPDRELAATNALRVVRPLLEEAGLRWGPTGSVGFELATRFPAATPASDLDLLVQMPRGSSKATGQLMALSRDLQRLNVRVDCQVETCLGAAALAELTGSRSDVMVRTPEGPRLMPCVVAVK